MHEPPLLFNAAMMLGAALAVAWLFRILRAPTVIGFLVAGALIGPGGFGLALREEVAEFGLALLLFTVGLELSPRPLLHSGRRLIIASVVQIAGTALVFALITRFVLPVGTAGALLLGMIAAISSTAIILGHLSRAGLTDSIAGTISTGICLAQDVSVIALLLLLPLFVPQSGATWRDVLFRGLVSLGGMLAITFMARMALPFILERVLARGGRELTTLLAVAMACTGAWLAGLAGWSWALGACIAGLLLSETDLRHQFVADIMPFRDVFNALFFIALGMLVDFGVVREHALGLLIAVAATLVLKTALTAGAVVIAGWPLRIGLHQGLMLATVSEFGYILAGDASRLGLLPEGMLEVLIAYAVGTMVAGAAIVPVAGELASGIAGVVSRPHHRPAAGQAEAPEPGVANHVIVVGAGFTGHNLSRVLRAVHIPHVIIEMNRSLAAGARRTGEIVIVGDATQASILRRAAINTARAMVIVINDKRATQQIIAQARAARPDLYILARTHYLGELDVLYRLGAREVIAEELESSIEIFAHVLKQFGIPDNIIEAETAYIRSGRYAMLRGIPVTGAPPDLLRLLEKTAVQSFYVEAMSPAGGRSIRELDLRAATGVTIIAVIRHGEPLTNPAADLRIQAGDVLVVVGTHKQIDQARSRIESPPAQGIPA